MLRCGDGVLGVSARVLGKTGESRRDEGAGGRGLYVEAGDGVPA